MSEYSDSVINMQGSLIYLNLTIYDSKFSKLQLFWSFFFYNLYWLALTNFNFRTKGVYFIEKVIFCTLSIYLHYLFISEIVCTNKQVIYI